MKVSSMDESGKYDKANERLAQVKEEVGKVMVGQEDVIEQVLISILCDGNILLESNPGMGKTKMISTISKVLGLEFSRIQNTPDLMPSDITGTHIVDESADTTDFVFQKGPIFANMILADEINRATPKTQSALLEAMQEKQVTVGNNSYSLDDPFFLMATQNPIEQEGTYPLPEAQRDRFMMKVELDYPSLEEENKIVDRFTSELDFEPELENVISRSSLIRLQEFTRKVPIANDLREKAVNIASATREKEELDYGASPRASMNIVLASKARALIEGRNHVSEKDIKEVAKPVLRHRIGLSFQAEKQGMNEDKIIDQIIEQQ
ncbi:AAA family ATPase [Candidatus Nanohalobium constans]|uniref:MoxR-like ATPase n=1 Tax=Candidatus Nanohalobium constans TaxID=2565781 RepID=A0A5Q0UIH8_9ARCH|nr:MoxR family ATPase [Candidatus Nanohalobium constans]QGA80689.1 MoxR-like ATPase [Candidatus Nanohalobium constans]